jgi:hypothetical protein
MSNAAWHLSHGCCQLRGAALRRLSESARLEHDDSQLASLVSATCVLELKLVDAPTMSRLVECRHGPSASSIPRVLEAPCVLGTDGITRSSFAAGLSAPLQSPFFVGLLLSVMEPLSSR